MKKILIVENDLFIRGIAQEVVLQHFPDYNLLGSVSSVEEALTIIETLEPDLVLLDIKLPDGTAFDLLRKIEVFSFKIVFLSEHENYLQEVIKFSSVGFVSKPFDVSDLVVAIDKACEEIDESDYQQKIEILLHNTDLPAASRMVVFPTVNADQAVALSAIMYGEAIPGGCIMHIETDKDIFVPRPLRRYERLFVPYGFFRCHPLYVVNLKKIESIDERMASVFLDDGTQVPLEARKYQLLKQRFYQVGF
jgi:two-component system LytT family response regulator